FLKAVQLDRFHHLLSEIIAVGLSHRTRVSAMGTLIVYVLISLAAAILNFVLAQWQHHSQPAETEIGLANLRFHPT
ncbi:MAG TPA: hypothetical protein V6C84_13035, partial [Coleofasciculaceae cyanobacterium]